MIRFIYFLFILISLPAYAEKGNFYLTGFTEANNAADFTATATSTVRGFGMEIHVKKSKLVPYFGASFVEVKSNTIISEVGDAYTMVTAYGYAGLTIDLPITPFGELGSDLLDAAWSDGSDGEKNYIDSYFSFGAYVKLGNFAFVKAYYKKTWIRPYLQPNVTLSTIGTMVGISF